MRRDEVLQNPPGGGIVEDRTKFQGLIMDSRLLHEEGLPIFLQIPGIVPPEEHVLPLLDLLLEIDLDPPGEVSQAHKAREHPVMLRVDRREVELQKEERRQAQDGRQNRHQGDLRCISHPALRPVDWQQILTHSNPTPRKGDFQALPTATSGFP